MNSAVRKSPLRRTVRSEARSPTKFWSRSKPPALTFSISIIARVFTGAAITAARCPIFPAPRQPAPSSKSARGQRHQSRRSRRLWHFQRLWLLCRIVCRAKLASCSKFPTSIDFQTAAAVMLQGMTAHYLTHSTYPIKAERHRAYSRRRGRHRTIARSNRQDARRAGNRHRIDGGKSAARARGRRGHDDQLRERDFAARS